MRRRERPQAHSLLLPSQIGDPPKDVAEANTAFATAMEASRKAGLGVREARASYRAAKAQDAAPSVVRESEQAVEDVEHAYREAKRLEAKARHTLAAAIQRNGPALIEQLPIEERYGRVLELADEFGAELDRLADEVGVIQTIATIGSERTQARGFEPIRSQAGRTENPQAHLAALRNRAAELRDLAARLQQPERQEVAA